MRGLVLCIAALVSTYQLKAASFHGLGDLPGANPNFSSQALAVSADGSVVVGKGLSDIFEAFRWTGSDGMVGLGDLPGGNERSIAFGVSSDGFVVVGSSASDVESQEAFRWTQSGMVGLGILPGGTLSEAMDASNDGSVVVGTGSFRLGSAAFRWTQAEGKVVLDPLLGERADSAANAVSDDGSVIVGRAGPPSMTEAFRWTRSNGVIKLGTLTFAGDRPEEGRTPTSEAFNVSGDGSIVVGVSRSGRAPSQVAEAFRWSQSDGMMGLGDLPGGTTFSSALATSHDGSVVVGSSGSALGADAFVWDATHGMRRLHEVLVKEFGLDLFGWTLTAATGVSADGTVIVGYGTNPFGNTEAWIVSLGPLPPYVDCNADGRQDASDLACVVDIAQRDALLEALNSLPGDLDGNGDVAFADFLMLAAHFGQDPASYAEGNIDLENGVAFADFLVLADNYGKSRAAIVPEPSGWLAMVVGASIISARRRPKNLSRPSRESRQK